MSAAIKQRVVEIDVLRFIAALAVVFFHYAFRGHAADNLSVLSYPNLVPFAKYGYLGVDLFFMISGFVIFMTVSEGSLRRFLLSRGTRLYPAFWVCCTITFLASMTLGAEHFPVSAKQYLINMLCLGGAFGARPIDGAYWSLQVEIKFYLLVAILMALGATKRASFLLSGWLAISVFANLFQFKIIQNWLITDNAAYFIAGATLYLVWKSGLSLQRIALLVASFCACVYQATRFASAVQIYYHTPINAYAVASIVVAFFAVMLLVSLQHVRVPHHRAWLLLGALSYPLYLVHQFLGYILFNATSGIVSSRVAFWAMVCLAIGLAYLVHMYAERPIASSLKRLLERALLLTPPKSVVRRLRQ